MRNLRRLAIVLVALALAPRAAFAAAAIEVREVGQGDALVFIPGLGCPGELWDGVVEQLAKDHRCYVVTLACFGAPCADREFGTTRVIEEMAGLVEQAKLEKPTLIGHSFGGHLALRVAAAYPDIFAKLIIVDAQPFPLGFVNPAATPEQAAQQAAMLRSMIAQQDDDAFRKQQSMMLQSGVSDPARLAEIVEWQVRSDRGAIALAFYEMLSTDLRGEIAKIRARTLVLGTWRAGESIGMTRETARVRFAAQYSRLPDCTIVMADEARHFVMYDDPAWLVGEVRKFVGGSE